MTVITFLAIQQITHLYKVNSNFYLQIILIGFLFFIAGGLVEWKRTVWDGKRRLGRK
jgi:hypothetical protein